MRPRVRLSLNRSSEDGSGKRDIAMKINGHTTLIWTAVIVSLVWSVYSATAQLVTKLECLQATLYVCGNSWLINSVI